MIRFAQNTDRHEIRRVYKAAYPSASDAVIDFFFKNIWKSTQTMVEEQNGQIAAFICLNPHTIRLASRRIGVFQICARGCLPAVTEQDYNRKLLETALDMADHQVLLTLAAPSDADLQKNGFKPRYYRRRYDFERKYYPRYETLGITSEAKAADLAGLYDQFMKHFQGYMIPSDMRYRLLLEEISANHYSLYTLYKGGTLMGYYIAQTTTDRITLIEILYANGEALARLLAHAAQQKPYISVYASRNERLDKVIPYSRMELVPGTMVRINDEAMFRKCFQIPGEDNLTTVFYRKPMYYRENY